MSAAVAAWDPGALKTWLGLFQDIDCLRCRAEGPSPSCPNCGGVNRAALANGGRP